MFYLVQFFVNEILLFRIEHASLRVDREPEGFKVKGISILVAEKTRKWFLFDEAFHSPSEHPLFEKQINSLTVKYYRNFGLEKETLKEYLNQSGTGFEYKGVPLRPDLENSIKEEGKLLIIYTIIHYIINTIINFNLNLDVMNELGRIEKRKRDSSSNSEPPKKFFVVEPSEPDGSLAELKLLRSLGIEQFNPFEHQASVWLGHYLSKISKHSVFSGNEFFYLTNFLDAPSRQW